MLSLPICATDGLTRRSSINHREECNLQGFVSSTEPRINVTKESIDCFGSMVSWLLNKFSDKMYEAS